MEADLMSSEAKLWNTIYSFAEALVLRCAVELDLATIIHNHGASMSLSDLSLRLPKQPVSKDALYRIMRYLVHMKLFTQSSLVDEGEIRYGLAPAAQLLVQGSPKSMATSILLLTHKDFIAPWHYLKDQVLSSPESDITPFEKASGMKPYGYMAVHPEMSQLFNEGMANDSRLNTSALVKECSACFDGITTLVDVGGGTGTAAISIAKAFPHIKCTVFDLPYVVADAPPTSQVDFVGGDMFKCVPKADAVMMKSVLHGWGDADCIEILKKCKEAVPREGGKVIMVETVLNAESQHPYTKVRLASDLHMMLMSGKERTEEDWKKLIHDAGYRGYKITHISAVQSVIEAYPY